MEVDLGSKSICWCDSSQSYKFSLKQSLNSPTTSTLMISSPETLSFLDLIPYYLLYISLNSIVLPLCVYSSHFFLLLSCSFIYLFNFLKFFKIYFLKIFLSKPFTNPTYLLLLHLYNLFLVRFQSLLFRQVPCNPTFI